MTVKTRFAPSPTGMLHIGGARTALFNYLFAKHNAGEFLIRIEDTDKERSTEEAIKVIMAGLDWLGLKHDAEIIYQSKRQERHKAMAEKLVAEGKAYYCYATKEELDLLRNEAMQNNTRYKYDRRWRDKDKSLAPADVKHVIRLKAPLSGVTKFNDLVQGEITIPNSDQDDLILVRADGNPTYMLAVVVDDHDMGISHVIRGDDHLTNTSKQILIYEALGFPVPKFAHISLIHGPDGKKMSKRHGATAITEYQDLGVLAEAMRNYLLRLGFSHKDAEIISDAEAIKWFDFVNVGKSPARFDQKKLEYLNSHYLKQKDDVELFKILKKEYPDLSDLEQQRLLKLIPEIKLRSVYLTDFCRSCQFLLESFIATDNLTEKAIKILSKDGSNLPGLLQKIAEIDNFTHDNLYQALQKFAEDKGLKLKIYAQLIRVALTGSHASPSIFEVMEIFGKEEVLKRLNLLSQKLEIEM